MTEGGWRHVEDCKCLDASFVGGPITTDPRCAALPGGPRSDPERKPGSGDLIAFLRARLDEDEMAARAAAEAAQTGVWIDGAEGSVLGVGGNMHLRGAVLSIDDIGPHVARWDPARVLAEVEAKRRMLDTILAYEAKIDGEWACCHSAQQIGVGKCPEISPNEIHAVRLLALPYAEHPDYRTEWQV